MLDGNRRWARAAAPTPRRATGPAPTTSRSFLGWCEEVGVEVVTLWLLSTDNLQPARRRARAAAGDHRGRRRRPRRDPALAAATRSGALDLLPADDRRQLKEAADATARRRRHDRSTSPSATAGAARSPTRCARCSHEHAASGTTHRGAGRDPRRRAHRRAPLHQGPARPRPRHPHLGGAAARRASCSGRARTASSTSARPTGPTSARSTSCARCAPTPSATAASAPERRAPSPGGRAERLTPGRRPADTRRRSPPWQPRRGRTVGSDAEQPASRSGGPSMERDQLRAEGRHRPPRGRGPVPAPRSRVGAPRRRARCAGAARRSTEQTVSPEFLRFGQPRRRHRPHGTHRHPHLRPRHLACCCPTRARCCASPSTRSCCRSW